ncbi:MAG: hypothetical protein IPG79_18570 [Saprospiraceae bacterium]|nr:hypothetical protein [Saprospiraceae bacterium]
MEGKHRTLDCKKCHDNRPGTADLYKEFAAVKEIKCLTCHEDSHNNKFGENYLQLSFTKQLCYKRK